MIAGLVLAGGAGRRFGAEPKLLAVLDGRPLLEHAIRAQCGVAELEQVVVVLGARAELLRERIDFGRADAVVCEDWSQGQSASLRCGLQCLRGAERVLVTLGDQPLITAEAVARLVFAPPGARATYGGVPGHPVVLGPDQIDTLMTMGGDRGARDLLHGPQIDLGGLRDAGLDVDTPADLEKVRETRAAVAAIERAQESDPR